MKEAVIDRLREDICRNHFQPGQPLTEIKIAKSMNVSRGTVREALLQLKDEGLTEFIPHKGFSYIGKGVLAPKSETHRLST